MVSEKQLDDTLHIEKVLEEYKVLEPFKAFFNILCEICDEPVKDWDDYNVKLAVEGIGYGHTNCWNSEFGQFRQIAKAIQKFNKDTK